MIDKEPINMNSNPLPNKKNDGTCAEGTATSSDGTLPEEYKVGYGRAPKEHRFPPGTSGNPKGRPVLVPSVVFCVTLPSASYTKVVVTRFFLTNGAPERTQRARDDGGIMLQMSLRGTAACMTSLYPAPPGPKVQGGEESERFGGPLSGSKPENICSF
jgi:hypothetical protein